MPFLQSPPLPLTTPFPLCFPCSGHRPHGTFSPTVRPPWKHLIGPVYSTCRRLPVFAAATSNQELLQALVGSDRGEGEARSRLPAIRSYEDDLARLTLIGDVSFDQALTAAAADGGDAAEEHLSSGLRIMVIETVYPGGASAHSTVSTRLFLPSREVKEKARKIRGSLSDDILSGTTNRNILAMTFRQVVLQRLRSFELALFPPGTERDMGNLAGSREIPTLFTISSSNEIVISMLAEAMCSCALECTKRGHPQIESGTAQSIIGGWLHKTQRTASSDSSVCICSIPPNQILESARKRLDSFTSMKGRSSKQKRKVKHHWWAQPMHSNLDKIGGPGFSDWANEYVPVYKLQIDSEKFKDAKFQGWQKLEDNRWEVLLTHFQMVELANILDMCYEDRYTLPDKHLACGLVVGVSNGTRSENKFSWRMVLALLIGGCVLVSLRIMAQIHWQHLLKPRNLSVVPTSVSASEIDYFNPKTLETAKLEDLCVSVVKRIQDALDRHGDISIDKGIGVWTGELPIYLRKLHISEINGMSESEVPPNGDLMIRTDLSNGEAPSSATNEKDIPSTTQDIASYQVVLSRDGKVLGFQPTSRIAVNYWAANPLAKVLYEGKKLSPGFLEPSLEIPRPQEVAVIELLMSVNPDSWFVLARPFQ